MHKLLTPLSSAVKSIITFYSKQRIKELESSREKWKRKAMKRLDENRTLQHELEVIKSELKKIDDQA